MVATVLTLSKVTEVSFEHPWNADSPMIVTVFGIFTEVSVSFDSQDDTLNANSEITVTVYVLPPLSMLEGISATAKHTRSL